MHRRPADLGDGGRAFDLHGQAGARLVGAGVDELDATSRRRHDEADNHECAAHRVTVTGMSALSLRCEVSANATPVAAPAAATPTIVQSHHFL